MNRKTDRQTDEQTDRQTHRQTDRQTDEQTNEQADMSVCIPWGGPSLAKGCSRSELERRWKSDSDSESRDTHKEILSVAAHLFKISTALEIIVSDQSAH